MPSRLLRACTLSLVAFASYSPATMAACDSLPGEAEPRRATFALPDGSGSFGTVSALVWWPEEEVRTVVLAIHGSTGIKEFWGSIGLRGYSVADNFVKDGRAMVAIDLPAYGTETAHVFLAFEQYAQVINAVTRSLRTGTYAVEGAAPRTFSKVVGLGLSMGALLLDITQGLLPDSFDAIMPASWSHGGFSAEYSNCWLTSTCPPGDGALNYYVPNTDPAVRAAFACVPFQGQPISNTVGVFTWAQDPVDRASLGAQDSASPDDISRLITVPVLVMLGERDFYYRQDRLRDEPQHFTSSPDVELLLLPDTGHSLFHHLNYRVVHKAMDQWLDARSF